MQQDLKQHLLRIAMRVLKRIESTDRIRIVFYAFIFFALCILFYAFKYSVVEYDYYKALANKQQTVTVKNPVSRGSIYSNNTPQGVFATSTDLSDLAVDPKEVGSKEKLANFLTDTVYEEICNKKADDVCVQNAFDYIRQAPDDAFEATEANIKGRLHEDIMKRISKEYVDFVILKENLNEREMVEARNLASSSGSAFSVGANAIYVDPTRIEGIESLASELSTLFSIPREEVIFKLSKRHIRYVKILRKMGLATKDSVDARIKSEKTNIAQGRMTDEESVYHFLILEPNPTRFYPEKHMGGQIVGFVDNEWDGRYGVEGYFNEELKGKEWERIAKKDISGRTIGSLDLGARKMVNGTDIKLTIDRNVQKEITKILSDGIKEFRANKGSVVVMDPKTGAIIAMVSYPDFDPNNFGDVYEMERMSYAKYPNPSFDLLGIPLYVEDSASGIEAVVGKQKMKLRAATEDEIANRAIPKYKYKNQLWPGAYVNDAIGSLYEPGSVFKAITSAIGIDTGDIRPSDTYVDNGFVEIDNFKIKNVSAECIGRHTYVHALDWSCNVGMIDIAQKIGKSLFSKYIQDFGFGAKTNITLEGEVYGKLDPYEKWSRAKLFTMSFGQGITATVLQMAAAYSVIANGGVYMQPYIVDSLTLADGSVIKNAPTPLRRVIKEETSKKVIAMLTEGATIGFARKGGVDGYDIAGKTGTSQIASKGGYETGGAGHTVTSYGGFAPASNPKFVMIVKIERPRTAEYSETTSSALFSKISKYLLNYYGIPKSQ